MAIVHKGRQRMDWPGFAFPERWRRLFDAELEHDGWLRMEEFREGDELVLRAEIPGIDPDKDVEISVSGDALSIRAHRRVTEEKTNKESYRSEFRYGELWRTLTLPGTVTADDVKATYGDGILEIRVPAPASKESATTTVPVTRV